MRASHLQLQSITVGRNRERATRAGDAIRDRRRELGLSQQELADAVGVDRRSVGAWETGRHFPARYLSNIAAVLGLRLDDRAVEYLSDQELLARVRQLAEDLTVATAELETREGYGGHGTAAAEPGTRTSYPRRPERARQSQ